MAFDRLDTNTIVTLHSSGSSGRSNIHPLQTSAQGLQRSGKHREKTMFMHIYHRITDWFGLEGTLKIIWSNPPAMGRDPFHQPEVLPAPSSLALNPAREGPATASLGSLGQGLSTLTGKNFFLLSNLNPA